MPRRLSVIVVAAVAAAFAASAALAAAPDVQRIEIDQTVPDRDLSLICGFPVSTRAQGHMVVRRFEQDGTGVVELTTYSLQVAAVANGNTYPFPAHGGSMLRIAPDGTEILMTFGMTSTWTGVAKVNLTTGEVTHWYQREFGVELDELCAALGS